MIQVNDLIALTTDEIKTRARSVTIYYLKGYYNMEANAVYKHIELKAKDMSLKSITHLVTIKLYNMNKDALNDLVWCTCDCEDFLFVHEVANAYYGSTSVINSNGMIPTEKNPNMMPGLCKHIMSAFRRINQYKINDPYDLMS